RSCRTLRCLRRSRKRRETRLVPDRYRRMPIACLEARASLYLYECCRRGSIRSRADDRFQQPDRLRSAPPLFHGGSPKSLTPLTSNCLPGSAGRTYGLVDTLAWAPRRYNPRNEANFLPNSRWPRGGDAFSNTTRPGTTRGERSMAPPSQGHSFRLP